MTIEYPLCLLAFACSSQNPPPLPPFPRRCMFQPTQSSRQLEVAVSCFDEPNVPSAFRARRLVSRGASARAQIPI